MKVLTVIAPPDDGSGLTKTLKQLKINESDIINIQFLNRPTEEQVIYLVFVRESIIQPANTMPS